MNNQFKIYSLMIAVLMGAILSPFIGLYTDIKPATAATVTTGVTFTTNQTVEYYHLNNAINNATVSDIVSGDITDGTIAAVDLGANSVTTGKILDETITSADILNRGIASVDIATNAITETELSTNITFRPGFLFFTNNVIFGFNNEQIASAAINGTNASGGASEAGKVVKLNASGKVDDTMLNVPSVVSNSLNTFTASGTAYTWTQAMAVTTTVTSGSIMVVGKASVASANSLWVRVRDSGTNIVSVGVIKAGGIDNGTAEAVMVDRLSGATKIYCMDVATDGSSIVLTNQYDTASSPLVNNGLGLWMNQTP